MRSKFSEVDHRAGKPKEHNLVPLGLPTENMGPLYFSSKGDDACLRCKSANTVCICDIDGENPKKLTDAGQTCEEPDGSPDGQWILLLCIRSNENQDYLSHSCAGGDLRKFNALLKFREQFTVYLRHGCHRPVLAVDPTERKRTTMCAAMGQYT